MGLYVSQRHLALPHVMLRQTTTPTTLTSGSYTAIVWDTIDMDPFGMGAAASATVTIKVPGMYLCEGAVAKVATATANRFFVALQFGGAQYRGTSVQAIVSGNPTTGVARHMRFIAGDTVKLAAFHDEGVNRNTATAENAPYFNVVWRAP